MTHAFRTRWAAALLTGALAVTLSACSGDPDEPAPTSPVVTTEPASPTETATDEPTEEPTETATTAAPATETAGADPTDEATDDTDGSDPTGTAGSTPGPQPTGPPTEGAGAPELATIMPDGFPLPEDLTITGDPTATAENWNVAFTVPDPEEAFEFFLRELPEAGYELQAGTSDHYSPEVSSGAILAQSDDYDVNLLIVDDQVEITITTR